MEEVRRFEIFGNERVIMGNPIPKFSLTDSYDPKRLQDTLIWFFKNDPQVRLLSMPTLETLYSKGLRPKSGSFNDPEEHFKNVDSLLTWFAYKITLDVDFLKEREKAEIVALLDIYSEGISETIQKIGLMAIEYELNAKDINLREIDKIPEDQRLTFKMNYMDDNVLAAELRILSWIYLCTFGTQYKDDSQL